VGTGLARIAEIVQSLEDQGLFVEGMTAVTFGRIWYALFFGQVALEGQRALSVDSEAWSRALEVLTHSIVVNPR
jgi:hypothetical protein